MRRLSSSCEYCKENANSFRKFADRNFLGKLMRRKHPAICADQVRVQIAIGALSLWSLQDLIKQERHMSRELMILITQKLKTPSELTACRSSYHCANLPAHDFVQQQADWIGQGPHQHTASYTV